MDYAKRVRALQKALREHKLDGLLVTHAPNWTYLTGFTGESGALVVSQDGATLITDGRFTVQAKEEMRGVRVDLQEPAGLYATAGAFLKKEKITRIGFDPNQLTVTQQKTLRKAAGAQCKWIEAPGLPERLRAVKDADELALMRKAAILVGQVFEAVLPQIRPGIRENEVAAELEYQMRKHGASGASFPTIVAGGKRAALPHARPTGRKLGKNELVVLDLGVILGQYCSDMTRTVHVGRAPRRVKEWYWAVQDAQEAAVAAVQSGTTCGAVDEAAREVLQKHGLEKYFVHSTGHGLGLEVHEQPRIAKGQAVRLEAGNVITIEPGVYVEGVGGIRIEDDVAVHAANNEVLTRVSRDLIEL